MRLAWPWFGSEGVKKVAFPAWLGLGLRKAQAKRGGHGEIDLHPILSTVLQRLGLGFLTLSAIAGSALLLALTLIGIVVSPAAILLAVLTGFAGYVIGVYAFGVGLMLAIGRDEPRSIADKALAAGAGAVVAGILALIPFLGWLFVLALTLAGVGAICMRVFSPHFFTEHH